MPKIEVVFTNNNNTEMTPETPSTMANQEQSIGKPSSTQTPSILANSALKSALVNAGKSMVMSGLSMYGNLTGDYLTQNKIDDMVQITSTAIMALQFPVGTIAATASFGVNTFKLLTSYNLQNRDIALLRERTGNEALNNSERGRMYE